MRYEKFIFAFCSLLFALCSCNKVVEEPKFISESQQAWALGSNGTISCWTGLMMEVSGDTIDLTKFGFYHNELMKGNFPSSSPYLDSCLYVGEVMDSINSRILTSNFTDLVDFIPPISTDCEDFMSISRLNFWITDADEYNDSLVSDLESSLSWIESKGYLNEEEKILLLEFVSDIRSGAIIDPCALRTDWAGISSRAENGMFSGSALSLGIYSYTYWSNILDEEEDQALINIALTDLLGFMYGYFHYMYNNWENHYDPQFGINALKAGGNVAATTSLGSIIRR